MENSKNLNKTDASKERSLWAMQVPENLLDEVSE